MQLTVYSLPFSLYFKLYELLCYYYKCYLSAGDESRNEPIIWYNEQIQELMQTQHSNDFLISGDLVQPLGAIQKSSSGGCKYDCAVKRVCCFSRRPKFSSQLLCLVPHNCLYVASGDQTLYSGLYDTCTHMNTHTQLKGK